MPSSDVMAGQCGRGLFAARNNAAGYSSEAENVGIKALI